MPIPQTIKSGTVHEQNIINRLATGENQVDIASDYNTTQTKISNINVKNKDKVKWAKQQLLQAVPSILETVHQDISNNQSIATLYATDRTQVTPIDIAYKSILQKQNSRILESVDILTSRTNLQNFGNIQVNQQHNTVISQSISKEIGQVAIKRIEELSNVDVSD